MCSLSNFSWRDQSLSLGAGGSRGIGAALGWRRRSGVMARGGAGAELPGRSRTRADRSAREGYPACVRSQISGWRGGALYPLAVAADRRGRFIFYGSAMAERRRGCGWPPAPPRHHFGSRCCARSGIAPRQPFSATSRARARRRFQIAVSFFGFGSANRVGDAEVGGAGRRWCRRRSSIAAELRGGCGWPPAPPRHRRGAPACSCSRFSGWISGWRGGALYPLAVAADRRGRFIFYGSAMAEATAARPRPRATTLVTLLSPSGIAPRQPFSATSRRGISAVRIFFLVSAAPTASAMAEVGGAGRRWCRRRS